MFFRLQAKFIELVDQYLSSYVVPVCQEYQDYGCDPLQYGINTILAASDLRGGSSYDAAASAGMSEAMSGAGISSIPGVWGKVLYAVSISGIIMWN